MNKYWGIPAKHDDIRQTKLITDGPFSYTRNPIYVCMILLFIGFSIALRSFSILLVPLVVYTIYKTILIEEKLLLKKFGKEYETYMAKVPRFI
jgi:protein-S-isoprenylcysteine O-methyltransferase Ste14